MKKSILRLESLLSFCLVFFSAFFNLANAEVIYVNQFATGNETGDSWADAFKDLQAALAIAQAGDEIWVVSGDYQPTKDTDRYATFNLPTGVALYGGFVGGETSRSERDATMFPTFLNGNIGVPASKEDNSYSIITVTDPDTSTIIDGFRIINGSANGRGVAFMTFDPARRGAGILIKTTGELTTYQLVVRNCFFGENNAEYGAAIFGDNRTRNNISLQVFNCRFERNVADFGAIYSTHTGNTGPDGVVFEQCEFIKNSSNLQGGIYLWLAGQDKGHLLIGNCLFEENNGTIIEVIDTENQADFQLNIIGSQFIGNGDFDKSFATIDLRKGRHSVLNLEDVVFRNNNYESTLITAFQDTKRVNIKGCVFESNTVGTVIEGRPREIQIDSCQILNNTGGISVRANDISIKRTLFAHNSANTLLQLNNVVRDEPDSLISLADCMITGNTSNVLFTGGGDSVSINNLYLLDNNSEELGGIHLFGRKAVFRNSLFARKLNGIEKEGFVNRGESLQFEAINCTFYNFINPETGLLYTSNGPFRNPTSATLKFINSIIWDELETANPIFLLQDTRVELINSLIKNNSCEESYRIDSTSTTEMVVDSVFCNDASLFGVNPKFSNVTQGDHTLQICSPAIDRGDNAALPNGITVDLGGQERIMNNIIDQGAYESQASSTLFEITTEIIPDSGASDGRIDILTIDGGEPEYNYNWSDGSSTASIDSLMVGNYALTITDQNGCSQIFTFEVDVLNTIVNPLDYWGVRLFPNPIVSEGMGNLQFDKQQNPIVKIRLLSMQKQLLWEQSIQAVDSNSTFLLPKPSEPGLYLIELTGMYGKAAYLKWIVH